MNRVDASTALDPYNLIPRIASGELRIIRQSMMGSADICLRRLGYDLAGHKGTGEARIVGTAYHAGLERLYTDRREGRASTKVQLHKAAEDAFAVEAQGFDGWATTSLDAAARVVSMLDAYVDGGHEWPEEYEVLGVEQEWFLPLFGRWVVKGTIDLVLRGPIPGLDRVGVILDDHKTAGRKWPKNKHDPRKQPQPGLYAWAWYACTGVVPDRFVYDVMTYEGLFERRWTTPTSAHMQALLDKATALTQVIEAFEDPTQMPANPTSNLCSSMYCDAWAVCPFGEVLAAA